MSVHGTVTHSEPTTESLSQEKANTDYVEVNRLLFSVSPIVSNPSTWQTTSENTAVSELRPLRGRKLSLSQYFSIWVKIITVLCLFSITGIFIWANLADGTWVRLHIYPNFKSDPISNPIKNTTILDELLTEVRKITALLFLRNIFAEQCSLFHVLTNDFIKLNINEFGMVIPSSLLNKLDLDKNVYHFTLFSSVKAFWQSGAYSLAILIAVFSGVWPYVKLCLLLLIWVKPLHTDLQNKILIFLDQFGKYSFLDLYV